MARKDAGLMIDATTKTAGINLTVIPSVAALTDEWIAKGHANDDWCYSKGQYFKDLWEV